jgi:hypothetical protein
MAETRLEAVIEAGRKEFPKLKLVKKASSTFMSVIDVLLRIITFNQQKSFMTNYTTVIGNTIYTPDSWDTRTDSSRIITIRHELVHFRQAKKYFFFKFLYLFVFFPIGLAYYRAKFEKEAYEEGMRAIAHLYGAEGLRNADRERVVRRFVSADYFWMWPYRKSVEKWYDETRNRILAEIEGK